ncbi:MAG: hypothetical protein R3C28_10145 [Pirellulaceae bacterium]
MKGPYERLKYDGHRIWECPVCHHRERTSGDRTTHLRLSKQIATAATALDAPLEDGVRPVDRETRTHVATEPAAQDQIAS